MNFEINLTFFSEFDGSFQIIPFASTAGGLRYWNAATFASFKNYASQFLNTDFVGTEPKDASYPVTGENLKTTSQNKLFSQLQ